MCCQAIMASFKMKWGNCTWSGGCLLLYLVLVMSSKSWFHIGFCFVQLYGILFSFWCRVVLICKIGNYFVEWVYLFFASLSAFSLPSKPQCAEIHCRTTFLFRFFNILMQFLTSIILWSWMVWLCVSAIMAEIESESITVFWKELIWRNNFCRALSIACSLKLIQTVNKRYGHTAHTFSRLLPDILIWKRFYFNKQYISDDW